MASKIEKRLRQILSELPDAQRRALLDYAEFLAQRYGGAVVPAEPLEIPRPEGESVVRAIRRLSATYPMLDRAKVLNETSALMTQHLIHGRKADEIIDELEVLFRRHFEQLQDR